MNNNICGYQSGFSFLREDRSRIIIGYELKPVEGSNLYEWYEVYFYKNQNPFLSFKDVKDAITADINAQTDEKILKGMVWTPISGNPIPVWLSTENQFNFKSAYDLMVQTSGATLPVTFKMGEDTEGNPVYHTFETMADVNDFYLKAVAHINQCLNEGWQRKDSIDWTPYKAYFPNEDLSNENT